jgi:hypothetical protein
MSFFDRSFWSAVLACKLLGYHIQFFHISLISCFFCFFYARQSIQSLYSLLILSFFKFLFTSL